MANSPSGNSRIRYVVFAIILVVATSLIIYSLKFSRRDITNLPVEDPDLYRKMISAFTIAATKLKVGDNTNKSGATDAVIDAPYIKPTKLVPEEPAGWANLALWYLRKTKPEAALPALTKAKELAPNSGQVEMLFGAYCSKTNKIDEARTHFEQAVKLDPDNCRIRFALADFLKIHDGDNAVPEILGHWQKILELQPQNVRAMIELCFFAAKTRKPDVLKFAIERLKPIAETWLESKRSYVEAAEKALIANDAQYSDKVQLMCNVAKDTLQSRQGSDALSPTVLQSNNQNGVADPLDRFLSLPNPSDAPAPPDMAISFVPEPTSSDLEKWAIAKQTVLVAELVAARTSGTKLPAAKQGGLSLLTSNGKTVRVSANGKSFDLPFPGGPLAVTPGPDGVLLSDIGYHFRSDVVMAGSGGLRLYRQTIDGAFTDATPETKIPAQVINGEWTGAWPVDVEQDGDLDIVLGSKAGVPTILRNNGDKTFAVTHQFTGISGVTGFVWADLDGDGDSDVGILDGQGRLHIFENLRGGNFKETASPQEIGKSLALSVCDVKMKSDLDLIVLDETGQIWRVYYKPESRSYSAERLIQWQNPPKDETARLYFADLDNNGAPDLIATGTTGTQIWLAGQGTELKALAPLPDLKNASPADPNSEGRIDLDGVLKDGKAVHFTSKGTKNYHWFILWPRSQFLAEGDTSNKAGDKRINTFGIGGSVELRSGLLDQLVPITGGQVHLGLGEYSTGDAVRIYWPNGRMNGYFDIQSGKRSWAEQNLGGSCPWLFAWNGKEMKFVTDILWSSPLGLRINSQGTAPVGSTLDWVKVGAEQLTPKDGFYELRITAELWETHFFDMVKLMTVDHPADTEIYVDERFSVPPLKPQIHVLSIPKPVLHAVDNLGDDVSDVVSKRDGRYLDTFGRGEYQGVTRDHYVEVDLGKESTPGTGKPYLVAFGWTHPTDSSINVALAQGSHAPPRMISLEIPDDKGGWKIARPREGFPAGKNKTMLFDLSGLFQTGTQRKVRLRTNLEVYWDYLGFATEMANVKPMTKTISPDVADLRFRGFSVINGVNTSSPETPDYNVTSGTGRRWLDLVGYYTRFGDVRELLAGVDDRYVILNAGDEIALRFPVSPAPPSGFKRDFVFVSDGWEKDGNFNTGFNQTVLPLPYHDDHTYSRPPTSLENDPVYIRHKRDWEVYQTRYVEPSSLKYALRPSR